VCDSQNVVLMLQTLPAQVRQSGVTVSGVLDQSEALEGAEQVIKFRNGGKQVSPGD
jgi:hypothetical protein